MGSSKTVTCEQHKNAKLAISSNLAMDGISTARKLLQPKKAAWSIYLIPADSLKSFKDIHWRKAFSDIVCIKSGIVTFIKDVQSAKARSPTSRNICGNSTLLSDLQPKKASLPIRFNDKKLRYQESIILLIIGKSRLSRINIFFDNWKISIIKNQWFYWQLENHDIKNR